jgi:hypothetical protein
MEVLDGKADVEEYVPDVVIREVPKSISSTSNNICQRLVA